MPMNNRLLRPLQTPGLLDLVPGAAAAYSLRSLSRSYAGPVVTVRRSSDNAEADFTASEVSDGTLAAWVGGGNDGFVKTWHDQSGNDRDATQATTAAQPKIVASGVVVTESGKPAFSFDGNDDTLSVASSTDTFKFLHDGTKSAVFSVARLGDSANPDDIYAILGNNNGGTANVGIIFAYEDRASSSANNRFYVFVSRGVSGTAVAALTNNDTLTPYEPHAVAVLLDVSNPAAALRAVPYVDGAFKDGGNVSTQAPSTANATYDLHLGSSAAGGAFMLGTISELIIYPFDMTALRQRIEGNLAWYY